MPRAPFTCTNVAAGRRTRRPYEGSPAVSRATRVSRLRRTIHRMTPMNLSSVGGRHASPLFHMHQCHRRATHASPLRRITCRIEGNARIAPPENDSPHGPDESLFRRGEACLAPLSPAPMSPQGDACVAPTKDHPPYRGRRAPHPYGSDALSGKAWP